MRDGKPRASAWEGESKRLTTALSLGSLRLAVSHPLAAPFASRRPGATVRGLGRWRVGDDLAWPPIGVFGGSEGCLGAGCDVGCQVTSAGWVPFPFSSSRASI